MRHLLSLIAGVVVAPLAWGLLAMGQTGTANTIAAWNTANAFDSTDLIKPAAFLAAAGVLLGLIATLRLSPLGPLVAGLAYLALYVGVFIDPFATSNAVPNGWKVLGEPMPLRTPLHNGTLLTIGALLIVATFSAKRWRAWPAVAGPAEEAPGEVRPGEEPTAPLGGLEGEGRTEPLPSREVPTAPPAGTSSAPAAPTWPPVERPATEPPTALPPARHAAGNDTTAISGLGPREPATGPSPSGDDAGSPWSAPPRGSERRE
jgi:hypothetical protein